MKVFNSNAIVNNKINNIYINVQKVVPQVGFEPTHLSILQLECSALDRSAITAYNTNTIELHNDEIYVLQLGCLKLI